MINQQTFDKKVFLAEFWQKKPLVIRQCFSDTETLITGDELAGLACEENIEARIIQGSNESNAWHCEFGPFEDYDYPALGEKNWTLLVQSVDHFIPEIRSLLTYFSFLPKWRLDDVMLSFAPPGGGVGPHFDYYDVFLIQTSGTREWKIGQVCNTETPLRNHSEMKLLETFTEVDCHQLNAGDMLYIPAGTAHWGTATSHNCITASVGFRAPAYQDLMYQAALDISDQFTQHQRYTDESTISTDSYNLDNIGQECFAEILATLDEKHLQHALRTAFAKEVTAPRHQELYEFTDIDQETVKKERSQLSKHPNIRCVYFNKALSTQTVYNPSIDQQSVATQLFVNGSVFETNLITAQAVCHEDFSHSGNYDIDALTELCRMGYLLIK